jgi:hypothetical protein
VVRQQLPKLPFVGSNPITRSFLFNIGRREKGVEKLGFLTTFLEYVNTYANVIIVIAAIGGILVKKIRAWILYCVMVGLFLLSPFVLLSVLGWVLDGFPMGNLGNHLYFILIGLVVTGVRFFYLVLLGGALRLVKFFVTWVIRKVRKTTALPDNQA